MRFLIIPGNNSLSHIVKSLAVQNRLISKGHECLIAITTERTEFLNRLNIPYALLSDIQENDGASYPTMNWFRDSRKIIDCIENEVNLIQSYKPDRVLGVFRFTAKVSSFLCGLPYYSLVCGCMLSHSQCALGFYDESPDFTDQRDFINMFFRSAAIKINRTLQRYNFVPVRDVREMFIGNQTFLWDIPEFMPVPEKNDVFHAGPVYWEDWPFDFSGALPADDTKPLAVLAFGTCNGNTDIAERMIDLLLELDYRVVVAAGGQEKLVSVIKHDPRISCFLYVPFHKIFPHASLVVCHGGQMTIFEALSHCVPVVVLPFHPEQAHNGICLERIGCGRMLVPACRFVGSSSVYTDVLDETSDAEIKSMIAELVDNPDTAAHLKEFKKIMGNYNGIETITGKLEQS